MDNKMTPQQMRDWRKEMHLTQEEAAAIMGYSVRQWIKYEDGTNPIRACMWYACRGYADEMERLANGG